MKTFIFKTKEIHELDIEYYVNAESEKEARKKYEAGDCVDIDENFVATVSLDLISVKEQK